MAEVVAAVELWVARGLGCRTRWESALEESGAANDATATLPVAMLIPIVVRAALVGRWIELAARIALNYVEPFGTLAKQQQATTDLKIQIGGINS